MKHRVDRFFADRTK